MPYLHESTSGRKVLIHKALTLFQVKCDAVPGYVCMMGPTLAYTEHQTGYVTHACAFFYLWFL